MRQLLLLFLFASPAFAQDNVVSFAETDKAEYAYGETIELRYTMVNEGDEAFTLTASNWCQAGFEYGSLLYPQVCDLEIVHVEFPPHSSRTWLWHIVPNEHGVPEEDGEQSIAAFWGISIDNLFPTTVTFAAPTYLGGRILFRLQDGLVLDDVQDVLDALNAEILSGGSLYYFIEIEGITLAEALATYESDPRFRAFNDYRPLGGYSDIFITDTGESSPLGSPTLTVASPNPFTTSTTFALSVPTAGATRVEVFDLLGRRVATLHDGPLTAAEHHFTFHASTLPAGLYLVRATGDGFTQTRRVTLAR